MTDYAEEAVLAGIIVSNGEVLDDLTLTGADFADGNHAEIFEAARRLRAERKPVDQVSLSAELPKHSVFLWSLTDRVPNVSATSYHAELVHEAAVRREVRAAGVRVQSWADELSLSDLAEQSRASLDKALGLQKHSVKFMQDTIAETVESIGKPSKSVPTPWVQLNDTIGGFRPGALYVVGARPGVGKTSIAVQAALGLSEAGVVAFSSLEMPETELHKRAMSTGAWIPHAMLDAPSPLPGWARDKLTKWLDEHPKRIAFDDRGSVTVNDIRTHARSVSHQGKLAGVVVDYLQLISGRSDAKRLEVVTEASRQLKLLARDLDCPVIALSQLNRNSESRTDRRPALSDLRESGSIEQDADVVILLHRDMEARDNETSLDMLVAKNRHGQTRALQMEWHGEFMSVL